MRVSVAVALRLLFAAAALAGVGVQLGIAIRTDFGLVNFFSYFTTLGNLFASTVFIVGAIRIFQGKPDIASWEVVRGSMSSTTC